MAIALGTQAAQIDAGIGHWFMTTFILLLIAEKPLWDTLLRKKIMDLGSFARRLLLSHSAFVLVLYYYLWIVSPAVSPALEIFVSTLPVILLVNVGFITLTMMIYFSNPLREKTKQRNHNALQHNIKA